MADDTLTVGAARHRLDVLFKLMRFSGDPSDEELAAMRADYQQRIDALIASVRAEQTQLLQTAIRDRELAERNEAALRVEAIGRTPEWREQAFAGRRAEPPLTDDKQTQGACDYCNGRKRVGVDQIACPRCKGTGVEAQTGAPSRQEEE